MLRAIVFDLDGVLINSEPLMRFAFEATYRQIIGAGQVPIEAYLEHMGESFPRIMDHLGLPHTLWEPYRQLCQQHIDRIKLFPQTWGILNWARARGLKLAILTGKDYARTVQILDHFDLSSRFHVLVSSDLLRYPKPHPEGLYRVLEHLSCAPHEAVMIGDSTSDVLCAQRAGIAAIAVTWGIKPERVQTLCQPDHLVHTWDELACVLAKLHGTSTLALQIDA